MKATIESWAGQIDAIGPIYPWLGAEGWLCGIGIVLFVGWFFAQGRMEAREYAEEIAQQKRS